VFGVLIKCDRSSEFVRKIPGLSAGAQRGLKALIQSVCHLNSRGFFVTNNLLAVIQFQLKLEEEEASSSKLEDVEHLLAQKEAEWYCFSDAIE